MEIKAKCKYDFESVKALAHLAMYKKADPKKRLKFWTVVYAILFAIVVLEMLAFGMDTVLLCALAVEIAFLSLMYGWHFIVPKTQYKALAKLQNSENEYVFCDTFLKVSTKNNEYSGESVIEYSCFVKAYETTKYFFLFQTNNQAFLVDKNTIEGGTAEEIRNKLSGLLKNKYIVCKY